jgi:hypothetical protein
MSNSVQVASHPQLKKSLQGRLFLFAALFGFLFCAALTLAPMARNHGWSGEVNWEPWIGFTIWVVCYGVVQKFSSSWLHNADPYILPIVYLLIGWGSLTIWRLSPAFGLRQSMWIVIGSLALLAVLRIPRLMELLSKYRYIWLGLCFLLVGFTLLPGFLSASSQPSLWITVGSINIQPSEPLKLFLMVYLAAYYSDRLSISPRSWALILPSLVIILISTLLLILQKDLGTATLILMLYTFVLYTISRKRRVLLIAVIILILASVAGFFTIDVIRLRFEAWLNPWLDPTASNRSSPWLPADSSAPARGWAHPLWCRWPSLISSSPRSWKKPVCWAAPACWCWSSSCSAAPSKPHARQIRPLHHCWPADWVCCWLFRAC